MAFYEENPQEITKADVVVAIPSFNEADTIAATVAKAGQGLTEHFARLDSVLVNCDNHSADGTKEAFFGASTEIPKIYLSTDPGSRGKGSNLRNLFEKVRQLGARATVVVEADIKNVAPYWIRNLGEPLLKGVGYVCPFYVRHKYESTLTSSVVYPLTRCLYGRRVRQPVTGDFGFSDKVVDAFLDAPLWTEATRHFGVDIWMTTIAMNSRVPICQSFMGAPKNHRVKDPFAHLTVLFRQIVGTIFDLMGVYADFWQRVKWSKPTALFGTDIEEMEVPPPSEVQMPRLHEKFLQGFDDHSGMWEEVFDQTLFHKLQEIRNLGLAHFSLPSQTWAKILFDASVVYRGMEEAKRVQFLDSLLPLYLGKVLSFVKKTERMSNQQAEEQVENESMIFEENKPYLLEKWQ